MSLNRVEVEGTLTRDPDLRVMPSGTQLMEATLAVSEARWSHETGQQEVATTFVSVQLWDVLAERVSVMSLGRGDVLYVLGRLDQKEIEKRDGTKDRKTRVQAISFSVVRSHKARPQQDGGTGSQQAGADVQW